MNLVVWEGMQGQLTGLLGNLSLLSYFAGKRERGATVVQAVGVLSTGVVISQLALGGAMPYPIYLGTAAVVVTGLLFNWLSYFNKLSPTLWQPHLVRMGDWQRRADFARLPLPFVSSTPVHDFCPHTGVELTDADGRLGPSRRHD